MRLFSWIYKCQNKDIKEQYDKGCRCFDLRVRWKNNKWIFAHGLYETYEHTLQEILNKLNGWGIMNNEHIYIRLILEINWHNENQETKFIELCKKCLAECYRNLIFFEARRKYDWNQLYNFGIYPTVHQYVGSMQSWWGRIFPRLWSLLYKEKHMFSAQHKPDEIICLFDFI